MIATFNCLMWTGHKYTSSTTASSTEDVNSTTSVSIIEIRADTEWATGSIEPTDEAEDKEPREVEPLPVEYATLEETAKPGRGWPTSEFKSLVKARPPPDARPAAGRHELRFIYWE